MKNGVLALLCAIVVGVFIVLAWQYLAYEPVTFGGKGLR